jgi:hypothetical protein
MTAFATTAPYGRIFLTSHTITGPPFLGQDSDTNRKPCHTLFHYKITPSEEGAVVPPHVRILLANTSLFFSF